jgi:hypothetical protein
MVQSFSLFSQVNRAVSDTIQSKQDTVAIDVSDTLLVRQDTITIDTLFRKPSASGITSKITYKANDVIKRDIKKKQFILVNGAQINYEQIEIKADSIVIDMNTNILFAIGRKDSTGNVTGKPEFKEGSNEFLVDELNYNFKTRKAFIKNLVTKQDAGLLHSSFTKLLEDGSSNISKSTYSTCEVDTPHFYINLPKARVYPGKKIVSGPGNLVVEGIPLPLAIPFGYFPVQTKKAASGLIIPRYGEERERGFSLTDGGYYFSISDYFDLSIKGSVYANGSWLASAMSEYRKLYKYSGNFSFSYANNISGHMGLDDYVKSTNYSLGWNYAQDPKASPGSRFSASVNMRSSGYDKENSYNVNDHVTTQRQSSISYTKTWDGTPFNFAISANQSQNVKTNSVSLNLPKANFNIGRIYPFRGKNSAGSDKWYQQVQLSYTASLDNQIETKDSLLFTSDVWKKMKNGFTHDIPLSLQIRPFNNFSISPSITYSAVLYSQKIVKNWDPEYTDPSLNTTGPAVVNDTIRGAFYGQALSPSISASFNPQIYGTYDFTEKSPNSRIEAIRHVIKPSIGFNYIPSFGGLSTPNMYRQVQVDTIGTLTTYSIYERNIYGTPSLSSKSGNITLSLVNLIEAKVFEKNDTTGKAKKIKIIDNLGVSTAYNIFADSLNWAPVALQARTTIKNNININTSASFSLYGANSSGTPVGEFLLSQTGRLMRLTSFNASVDFSLSDLLKKNKDKTSPASQNVNKNVLGSTNVMGQDPQQMDNSPVATDAYGYPVFNVPWTMNLSYSFNYSKPGNTSSFQQYVTFQGSLSLTKKMAITYLSGYDFQAREITMTNIGITRDLHCWEMSLNWVPNGNLQSWSFLIRVKAPLLGDMKYERKKDFHDQY